MGKSVHHWDCKRFAEVEICTLEFSGLQVYGQLRACVAGCAYLCIFPILCNVPLSIMTVMAMLMSHWYYVGFELCLLQTRGPRDRQGLQPLPGKPGIYYTAVLTIAAAIYCLQLMPNAYHVYEKVVQSITDDLNQDVLLGHITKVLQAPLYDKDEGRASQARGPA